MDELSLAIAQISFISLKEKIILHKNLDSLDKLALMSMEDISQIVGRTVNPAFWDGRRTAALAQRSALLMQKMQIGAVRYDEASYPALLREAFDPPFMLFYRGAVSILDGPCVSVVGTRRICREAAQAAFSFAADAVADGVTVVSGLAFGTDACAHKGALAGKTAAVLPCGIDTITPSAHKVLAQHILAAGGCIASEYVPGTPAESWRYVQRNRIIAALSPATVVIQAPPASGALITADFAVDYNRDVLFHKAGFCDSAQHTAVMVQNRLASSNEGSAAKKMVRTAERFLEEGAPVIENYAEYVAVRNEAPGLHLCKKNGQLQLF